MTIGNFEYRTPLGIVPIKGLGGAVFYDTAMCSRAFRTFISVNSRIPWALGFAIRRRSAPCDSTSGINLNPKLRIQDPNTLKPGIIFYKRGGFASRCSSRWRIHSNYVSKRNFRRVNV